MPLHHYGLPVGSHYTAMRDFYVAVLKPLGYEIVMELPSMEYCGFGIPGGNPEFWLGGGKREGGLERFEEGSDLGARIAPIHIAFKGETDQEVDEWYENAIKCGAVDNGKPGLRPQYTKGYYGAFVLDPLGNNVEVVHMNCVQ